MIHLSPSAFDYKSSKKSLSCVPFSLTRSIRDSETSIDFVQGPAGSRRERVKLYLLHHIRINVPFFKPRRDAKCSLKRPSVEIRGNHFVVSLLKQYISNLKANISHSFFILRNDMRKSVKGSKSRDRINCFTFLKNNVNRHNIIFM